jgi:anti-sigma regulatory factor (Ser/Thr protein kinase)
MLAFVTACARQYHLGRKKARGLEVAAEEVLVNICSYAYPDTAGMVTIRCCRPDDTCLAVEIIDKGAPFNPLQAPDPDLDLSLEERPVGGLGIFMARQLTDEIRYDRKDGCNILTLMVYLT